MMGTYRAPHTVKHFRSFDPKSATSTQDVIAGVDPNDDVETSANKGTNFVENNVTKNNNINNINNNNNNNNNVNELSKKSKAR
jgi:hypothetical protein